MAKKIDTIERDGRLIHIYDNGLELDAATGRIIKRPPGVSFTSQTGKTAALRRQELTQARIRRQLLEAHNANMPEQVNSSSAAFASLVGMLIEQVGMNSEAYPRDRIELLDKVGKWSGLVSDKKQAEDESARADALNAAAAAMNIETARILERVFRDAMRVQQGIRTQDVIEGKTIE